MRNVQKALLNALLTPNEDLKALQDAGNYSKLLALQEEYKLMPLGDVWAEFCVRNGVCPCNTWYSEIEKYEDEVLSKRV
jgi:L-rhamnose isomerase